MSTYVHIHVCFACDTNESVAMLAKRHLTLLSAKEENCIENRWWLWDAKQFLLSLSSRVGQNFGPKGGLSLWGMIGKNSKVQAFCEGLRPFWIDLLSDVEGGPCDFERIVVFEEIEQKRSTNVYQIGWDDEQVDNRSLVITKFSEMPFYWNQF